LSGEGETENTCQESAEFVIPFVFHSACDDSGGGGGGEGDISHMGLRQFNDRPFNSSLL